jgi:hypothetical protein
LIIYKRKELILANGSGDWKVQDHNPSIFPASSEGLGLPSYIAEE